TLGYAGPALLGHQLMRMALSEETAERGRGLWWLNTLQLEDTVLQACYRPVGTGLPGSRRWTDEDLTRLDGYREIYFRMTGNPYNSVPRPKMRISRVMPGFENREEERITDREVGGIAVAGRVAGLSLHASHMDANI